MNIHQILKQYWGYDQFRPLQEDIVRSVLAGKDTLALLPTGGGKSVCFQVPGMALDGLCLVISPLIALMKDQVENLKKIGIPAAALVSGMSQHEIDLILNHAVFGQLKFLYVSPERLESRAFLDNLKQMKIGLLAIDEAHCISQWGYDFRPPYLNIANLRQYIPKVPVMALTATATPEVVEDIQEKLSFKEKNVFQKSFLRDNLTYYVIREEDKLNRMLRIIRTVKGAGVIYVRNRRKTREIAEFLVKNNIRATYYHAGLDQKERSSRQAAWISDQTPVIVATNAFGMGIDKPNCRFVIHLDLPDSLEAYFQEAGRGGRDGKSAQAILLYETIDKNNLEKNFNETYPELAFIKSVYHALGNYFQIPVGSGKHAVCDFDLKTFSDQYKMKPTEVYSALKFLEKEGLLLLSEEINLPSKLFISVDKETLYRFQVERADFDPFIKMLLRSYGGLFTDYIKISESEIASRLHTAEEKVKKTLEDLHKLSLIDYVPSPKKPQIIYTTERLDQKDIRISREYYDERKAAARKRLDAVLQYAESHTRCRSQLLLGYFGETESRRCGKCDVCLKCNRLELSQLEFDRMKDILKPALQMQNLSLEELLELLNEFPQERAIKFVQWLADEEVIVQDKNEKFRWHKS